MASSAIVDSAWLQEQLAGVQSLDFEPSTIALTLLGLILVPVIASSLFSTKNKIPVINSPGLFQLEVQKKFEFVTQGMNLIKEGRKRFPEKPFQLVTNAGRVTVLPPGKASEIRNSPNLSFSKIFAYMVPRTPLGFGVFDVSDHPTNVVVNVVAKQLTKRLNTVTEPLTFETSHAVNKIMGNPTEWKEIRIYESILDLVARLSSRVFLGADLCRNADWLDITKNFAIVIHAAMLAMRLFPRFLRPLVYWFEPNSRKARSQYIRAVKMVEPIVVNRRKERAECIAKGMQPPSYNDLFEWFEIESKGHIINPTDFQLTLSFAAIHTTSDLITQTMLCLAAQPENIGPLREEMLSVLKANGWKKTALTNLKLMDSAIKEAQRLKPTFVVNMMRKVVDDLTLEDGTVLRKGEVIGVDTRRLVDPSLHKNPETYDMYRFYKMRNQPGGEHKAQLVSPNVEHLAFGHGKHMCPGRFFAANEMKVALCHLLLKYDWKLAPGTTTEPVYFGTDLLINPNAKLLYKTRTPEIDLDSLAVDSSE